jgi:uncharacterized membrane protein YfcA
MLVFALALVAFVAGAIDAVAGGGGLLTVPALLLTGLPPHMVLGTNKGQSVFGSLAAVIRYRHGGMLNLRRAWPSFLLGFVGALLGARLVLLLPPTVLRPVVLVMLPVAAALVLARPRGAAGPRPERWAAGIALAIGAYDGFFGPGTGTFLILAYVGILGLLPTQASANAKVVNFASNLAAAMVFAVRGVVVWHVALPMAAGQLLGGWLGAHVALRVGDRLVRAGVAIVVVAVVAKLVVDTVMPHAIR